MKVARFWWGREPRRQAVAAESTPLPAATTAVNATTTAAGLFSTAITTTAAACHRRYSVLGAAGYRLSGIPNPPLQTHSLAADEAASYV